MKRKTIPKIAVLATGLAAALLVATIHPTPAQAFPTKAQDCTNCHGSGAVSGTVTAAPSTTTPAVGAAYTVAITMPANAAGSDTGYWIANSTAAGVTGTTTGVTGGAAGTAATSYSAAMTAPATAGTYFYKVWAVNGHADATGVANFALYSITVGGPPPTTILPTTIPPTTIPPTTIPPTTIPPTTIPPTTIPPTTIPPWTDGDGDGDGGLSPTGALGQSHLSMYNGFGARCSACHNGVSQPKAPSISIEDANMEPGVACATCHGPGKSESEESLFITLMNNPAKTVYTRCSDCHQFTSNGESD